MLLDLSLAQKEIFKRELYYPETSVNNNSSDIVFQKDVDYETINDSVNDVIRASSSMRTQICTDETGIPKMYVSEFREAKYPLVELKNKDEYRKWINEKLNERGYNIEDQDWFANNLKSRVAVDSFSNAADIIHSAYDPEQGWNDEKLEDNEDLENYLDRAGFTLKK